MSKSPHLYRETKTKLGSFLELTQQAKNRARHHKDAKSVSERSRSRRRNSILNAVGDVISGRVDVKGGSETSASLDSTHDGDHSSSPVSTPTQSTRRRYQRRGSATSKTMEADSNHARREFSPTEPDNEEEMTPVGTPVNAGRRRYSRRSPGKSNVEKEDSQSAIDGSEGQVSSTSAQTPRRRAGRRPRPTAPVKSPSTPSISSSPSTFNYPAPFDFQSPGSAAQPTPSAQPVRTPPQRRLSAPPQSHSPSASNSPLTTRDQASQPQTIDERPIPRRNSSHHRRPSADDESVTTIDQLPLPMRTSSHHGRASFHNSSGSHHHRNYDDGSVVSGASFHDDEEDLTIDQRPLPLKEISTGDSTKRRNSLPPRAALPPLNTPSTTRQRSIRTTIQSAQTVRRPSPLPPRTPSGRGANNSWSNKPNNKGNPVSPSPALTSPDKVGSAMSSPIPALPFSEEDSFDKEDNNIISPLQSPKRRWSPSNGRHVEEENSPLLDRSTRSTLSRSPLRLWSSRKKSSAGALPVSLPFDKDTTTGNSSHHSRSNHQMEEVDSHHNRTSHIHSSNQDPSKSPKSKSGKKAKKRLNLPKLRRKSSKTPSMDGGAADGSWKKSPVATTSSESDSPSGASYASNQGDQQWTASPARHTRTIRMD